MDHDIIPSCALNRKSTTVIVRSVMEVMEDIREYDSCQNSASSILLSRLFTCEKCNRTRLNNNKYSDCDSGPLDKYRVYKSRSAKSRYVNVCAVVCLLLLIGGLSPRSSAAPYRSRTMDRQKRALSQDENSLWGDPCTYNNESDDTKAEYDESKHRQIAQKVVQQAKYSYQQALKYKDVFASKLYSSNFDSVQDLYKDDDWLRSYDWFHEEALPKEKGIEEPMPADKMAQLLDNQNIDKALPSMYKGLKMVVAGLYVFTESLKNDNISIDADLTASLNQTVTDVRSVLCYFYDLMAARKLEIPLLTNSEVPKITNGNKLSMGFLIYRDTLNYLDSLAQVFQKMAQTNSSTA